MNFTAPSRSPVEPGHRGHLLQIREPGGTSSRFQQKQQFSVRSLMQIVSFSLGTEKMWSSRRNDRRKSATLNMAPGAQKTVFISEES